MVKMMDKGQKSHWSTYCRYFAILVMVFGTVILSCNQEPESSSKGEPALSSNVAVGLKTLLSSAGNAEKAASLDMEQLLRSDKVPTKDSPMWPIFTFLVGEVHWLRKDVGRAHERYRALVEWAATNPYGDGWGGDGLVALALWRWLQILNMDPARNFEEANELMQIAESLMETRLIRRMFKTPVLCTLPQLEEDIKRQLSVLAWSIGSKDRAQRLFLDYLKVSTTAELGSDETDLMNHLISSGLASPDHLSLFRGKRLYSLKRYDDALTLLSESRKSKNLQVRAEAGYYLARTKQRTGTARKEVIDTLSSVISEIADPIVAQWALFHRALLYNREGPGRDVKQFLEDLLLLIEDFPKGRLADDALYEIARHYQDTLDVEQAIHYFEKVRNFKGKNDFFNLAAFQPAMMLYARGEAGDKKRAAGLLEEVGQQDLFDQLNLAALFWLGRIAAEEGDEKLSNRYFRRIIAKCPYDYYAIRARMHLNTGNHASKELWPDSTTRDELQAAYYAGKAETSITGVSPYHTRLRGALLRDQRDQTDLYSTVLSTRRGMRKMFPERRLEELSLEELDTAGMLSHFGLLLSLRQDAKAAVDVVPLAKRGRLQVASAVGHVGGDWPLSMSLVMALGEPVEYLWNAQQDDHYLATALPPVFIESIRKYSTARGIEHPELLYSIIKRESLFYPEAVSPADARGLFQFTRPTFATLDKEWHLLDSSGASSREAFLADPDLSIDLGARWFKDKLLPNQKEDILLSVMEHNAGDPAVDDWVANWYSLGRSDDIEYMIETARFQQTRIFARAVLTDMVIADAVGLLKMDRTE